MSALIAGGVIAGLGTAYKIGTGIHQNHLANQINPNWQQYQTSPYAQQQLGLAEQLFNGTMPGYQQEQQQIENSQSNFQSNVNRNATDSGQALALASGAQGISNNAYSNLQGQAGKYKLGLLDNLNTAYQSMVNEGNKVYQSEQDKYNSDVNAKSALRNAGGQNISSGINDLSSEAFLYNQYKNNKTANAWI